MEVLFSEKIVISDFFCKQEISGLQNKFQNKTLKQEESQILTFDDNCSLKKSNADPGSECGF